MSGGGKGGVGGCVCKGLRTVLCEYHIIHLERKVFSPLPIILP